MEIVDNQVADKKRGRPRTKEPIPKKARGRPRLPPEVVKERNDKKEELARIKRSMPTPPSPLRKYKSLEELSNKWSSRYMGKKGICCVFKDQPKRLHLIYDNIDDYYEKQKKWHHEYYLAHLKC